MGKNARKVEFILSDLDERSIAFGLDGCESLGKIDSALIFKLVEFQYELWCQATKLHKLNGLFEEEFPEYLTRRHMGAWSRETLQVREHFIRDVGDWESRCVIFLSLVAWETPDDSDIQALAARLVSELDTLQSRASKLRQAAVI